MPECPRLLQLGDKIVDTRILSEYFTCDLEDCAGRCCLEGDSGAPVQAQEVIALEEHLDRIIPYVARRGGRVLRTQGVCYRDFDGDWVTPLVKGAECAFSFREEGCYRCGIERAARIEGLGPLKPISCSLYPIRVGRTGSITMLRYDVWEICDAARLLGRELGVRVYEFLRKPLVQAFGDEFYTELSLAADRLQEMLAPNG